jgi:hypothetical protein
MFIHRSSKRLQKRIGGANKRTTMVAKPEISVSAEEPLADSHGQFWSPAKLTLTWSHAGPLPAPSVQVSLIAPIRGQMTVDQLRKAHIQAAHDVLNAALLSLEEAPMVRAKQKSTQR